MYKMLSKIHILKIYPNVSNHFLKNYLFRFYIMHYMQFTAV